MKRNIFLTGPPGSGKSTVIKRVVAELAGRGIKAAGFYTSEVRGRGTRLGFEIVTLSGRRATLAHVKLKPALVSKYGVDVGTLEKVGVAELKRAVENPEVGLVIVDEIGKMECLSKDFCDVVRAALDSKKSVLGTITEAAIKFADEVRSRRDVEILEVNPASRERLPAEILRRLQP